MLFFSYPNPTSYLKEIMQNQAKLWTFEWIYKIKTLHKLSLLFFKIVVFKRKKYLLKTLKNSPWEAATGGIL